jgi:hypothetical protein
MVHGCAGTCPCPCPSCVRQCYMCKPVRTVPRQLLPSPNCIEAIGAHTLAHTPVMYELVMAPGILWCEPNGSSQPSSLTCIMAWHLDTASSAYLSCVTSSGQLYASVPTTDCCTSEPDTCLARPKSTSLAQPGPLLPQLLPALPAPLL